MVCYNKRFENSNLQICLIFYFCFRMEGAVFTWFIWEKQTNTSNKDLMTLLDSRWRHQMETFSALLAICAGNSPVPGECPPQRPVTWSFDVFFDLHLNKRLSKESWGWWFETLLRPLWSHCNVTDSPCGVWGRVWSSFRLMVLNVSWCVVLVYWREICYSFLAIILVLYITKFYQLFFLSNNFLY